MPPQSASQALFNGELNNMPILNVPFPFFSLVPLGSVQ